MTDQLPSKECLNFSWSWDAEARNWRISMVDMGNGFMAGYDHLALYYERRLIQEIERLKADLAEAEADARAANVRADQMAAEWGKLRTALTGIQSCSTCEACRGAARLALGGETSLEAEIGALLHPDWCPTCTKPYDQCRCNGVAR